MTPIQVALLLFGVGVPPLILGALIVALSFDPRNRLSWAVLGVLTPSWLLLTYSAASSLVALAR